MTTVFLASKLGSATQDYHSWLHSFIHSLTQHILIEPGETELKTIGIGIENQIQNLFVLDTRIQR